MYPYVRKDFKVVEINNVVGLRSGHIIAQTPLAKAGQYSAREFVENGYILYLDVDGMFKAPGNANAAIKATQNPILHYTEELFTGPLQELKEFAVEWDEDGIAYPRGIVLNIGDTFTTNNFVSTFNTNATLLTVDAAGAFVQHVSLPATVVGGYTGPLFAAKASTLPDGINDAFEVTYLGIVTIASA